MKKIKTKKAVSSSVRSKSVKNKFVLTIGEEGTILAHYDKGRLENRIFLDSPQSSDIKLARKLFSTYPKSPIYMLIDVVEQNYTQQILPPVSSMALKGQVKRRMEKELRPGDFNNYIQLGRQKTGRRDWKFLFVSLANTDPFAQWFDFVMSQDNAFGGVYLLPIESQSFLKALSKFTSDSIDREWELLILHNKVGGFRIVALKDKKIIFTRQAQQLIGNNIPDVIVGNLEQEIVNTIEYLKRLGFKAESESRITIVAGADILQRVERESLGFAGTDMFTPYQAAEKLGLTHSLNEEDRFADVVSTTFFAMSPKPVLSFESPVTKMLSNLSMGIKATYILGILGVIALAALTFFEYQNYQEVVKKKSMVDVAVKKSLQNISEIKQKYDELPNDVDKMLDVLLLSKNFPRERELALDVVYSVGSTFNNGQNIEDVSIEFEEPVEASGKKVSADEYSVYAQQSDVFGGRARPGRDGFTLYDAKSEKTNRSIPKDKNFQHRFKAKFTFTFPVEERNLDVLADISKDQLKVFSDKFPDYEFRYSREAKAPKRDNTVEQINENTKIGDKVEILEAEIEVKGVISAKKKTDS